MSQPAATPLQDITLTESSSKYHQPHYQPHHHELDGGAKGGQLQPIVERLTPISHPTFVTEQPLSCEELVKTCEEYLNSVERSEKHTESAVTKTQT